MKIVLIVAHFPKVSMIIHIPLLIILICNVPVPFLFIVFVLLPILGRYLVVHLAEESLQFVHLLSAFLLTLLFGLFRMEPSKLLTVFLFYFL